MLCYGPLVSELGGGRVHGAPNPVIGGGPVPPPAPPPMYAIGYNIGSRIPDTEIDRYVARPPNGYFLGAGEDTSSFQLRVRQ